jgi:hypothetical protein
MKFRILYQTSNNTQSPVRIVEEKTKREVGWTNRYLDREHVRRLGGRTLRTYAHNLLHFVRWWESIHRRRCGTGADRIDAPGLCALSIEQRASPFRFHY